MPDQTPGRPPEPSSSFTKQAGNKIVRKRAARNKSAPGLWFGLGMMGLIGWSVVVPTLVGAGIGLWIDRSYPSKHAWTLALLVIGLAVGCLNAWHWVSKEERAMREEDNDDNR